MHARTPRADLPPDPGPVQPEGRVATERPHDGTQAFIDHWRAVLGGVRDSASLKSAAQTFAAPSVGARLRERPRATAVLARAWSDVLLEHVYGERERVFSLDLLHLPPLFAELGWSTPDLDRWRALAAAQPAVRATGTAVVGAFLSRLLARSLADGPQAAVEDFVRAVPLRHRDALTAVGRALAGSGWYAGDPARVLAATRRRLASIEPASAEAPEAVHALLGVVGYHKHSDRDWLHRVYREVALPALRDALARDHLDLALELEYTNYQVYLRQTETSQHVARYFADWAPQMIAAGHRHAARVAPPARRPVSPAADVAFFVPFASWLAHVRTLVHLLQAVAALEPPPFRARVYLFEGEAHELPERLRALGVDVEFICARAGRKRDWLWRLERLRERLTDAGTSTLVFVSSPIFMAFATSIRTAPVQIWWSLKYHVLQLPDLDGYITGGSVGETRRTIEGREWRIAPSSLSELFEPAFAPEAARIRATLSNHDVILGSLVRAEKLLSPPFLDALARILAANPGAVFLWFGRRRDERVERELADRGVAENCRYCGWVSTRLYAQVLDIHLDTFPFPAGVTMIETTAAGVPGVNYVSVESRNNGLLPLILPMLDRTGGTPEQQDEVRALLTGSGGESLLFCARSPDEYVAAAQRLIDEPQTRKAAGEAMRRAFDYLNRPSLTAQRFAFHLSEIAAHRTGTADGA